MVEQILEGQQPYMVYGMKMINKNMGQGKREEQIQFSMMMFMLGLIGMIGILAISLVAVVGVEVWSWLCG